MNKLTATEAIRLKELERTIRSDLRSFMRVGIAILEIRDNQLYREKYKTFDQYCKEQWGWQRQRGYELIEAAKTVKSLPEKCNELITNVGQATALSKANPQKRQEIIERATKGGKPLTAAAIRDASKCPPCRHESKKSEKKDVPKDETKLPIPPEILEAWDAAVQDANRVLGLVSSLRAALREAKENDNPSFSETDFTDNQSRLDSIFSDLKRVKPHAVCFDCNGVNFKNCHGCKNRGWISKFFYDTCVPEEKKKITKR